MSFVRKWATALPLAVLLASAASVARAAPDQPAQTADLKQKLMNSVHKMDDAHSGLFDEDVTSVVAPSFPPGQSMEDTQAVLKREGFGELHKFKGEYDHAKGTMYVSTMKLMVDMSSSVAVVLDLDFMGASPDKMKVRSVKAFVRSKSM